MSQDKDALIPGREKASLSRRSSFSRPRTRETPCKGPGPEHDVTQEGSNSSKGARTLRSQRLCPSTPHPRRMQGRSASRCPGCSLMAGAFERNRPVRPAQSGHIRDTLRRWDRKREVVPRERPPAKCAGAARALVVLVPCCAQASPGGMGGVKVERRGEALRGNKESG